MLTHVFFCSGVLMISSVLHLWTSTTGSSSSKKSTQLDFSCILMTFHSVLKCVMVPLSCFGQSIWDSSKAPAAELSINDTYNLCSTFLTLQMATGNDLKARSFLERSLQLIQGGWYLALFIENLVKELLRRTTRTMLFFSTKQTDVLERCTAWTHVFKVPNKLNANIFTIMLLYNKSL